MEVKTEMNIEMAVKHLGWRLSQNKMNPNQKDIESFNFIVRTLNKNHEEAVMNHKCFAKLLIEKLLFLTIGGQRDLKHAISIIEEILDSSMTSWVEKFIFEVPLIRFGRVFEKKYVEIGLTEDDRKNIIKVFEANKKIIEENSKELSTALLSKYTKEEFAAFFDRLVFELIKKYQNQD